MLVLMYAMLALFAAVWLAYVLLELGPKWREQQGRRENE